MSTPINIAVFGLYKTGTTAIYSNILNSLPYQPRVLFEEKEYHKLPEDHQTGVLAKVILGHQDADYPSFFDFDKKVVITRDPRDWFISGCIFLVYQYVKQHKDLDMLHAVLDVLQQKIEEPASISMKEIAQIVFSYSDMNWEAITSTIFSLLNDFQVVEEQIKGKCIITYEDFIDRNLDELGSYLGMNLSDEVIIDTAYKHVPRSMTYNNWKNWFLPEDLPYFMPLMNPFLQKYGYKPDWELAEFQTINPDHVIGYLTKNLNISHP